MMSFDPSCPFGNQSMWRRLLNVLCVPILLCAFVLCAGSFFIIELVLSPIVFVIAYLAGYDYQTILMAAMEHHKQDKYWFKKIEASD